MQHATLQITTNNYIPNSTNYASNLSNISDIDAMVAFVQSYIITPEDRRGTRRDACGSWMGGPHRHTGILRRFQLRCSDYRYCDYCRLTRTRAELSRVRRAQSDGMSLYRVVIDDSDWCTIMHRLRRHGIEYRRYPQNDNRLIIILNGQDDKLQLEPLGDVTEDEMSTILFAVPLGRHITGSLGGTMKTDESRNNDIASIESISTDGGMKIECQAWELAIQDTLKLDPHTIPELEQACMERMAAYKKHLRLLGAKVLFSLWRRVPVQIERIQWQVYAKSEQRVVRSATTQAVALQ